MKWDNKSSLKIVCLRKKCALLQSLLSRWTDVQPHTHMPTVARGCGDLKGPPRWVTLLPWGPCDHGVVDLLAVSEAPHMLTAQGLRVLLRTCQGIM